MCGQPAVQVVPARRDFEADSGKFQLVRLERHDLGPIKTLRNQYRLIGRTPYLIGGSDFVCDVIVSTEIAFETLDGFGQIGGVFGDDLRIEGWLGVYQRTMPEVEDQTAGRRHPMQADAIAIGQLAHLVMLHNLQVVETHRDQPEHRDDRCGQNGDSRLERRDWTVLWFGAKLRHGTFPSIIYSRTGPTGNPVSR